MITVERGFTSQLYIVLRLEICRMLIEAGRVKCGGECEQNKMKISRLAQTRIARVVQPEAIQVDAGTRVSWKTSMLLFR